MSLRDMPRKPIHMYHVDANRLENNVKRATAAFDIIWFITVIGLIGLGISIAVKVNEYGVKGVAQSLWCGNQPNCNL